MLSWRNVLRPLVRSPVVSTVAIGSLALGIGANAAIFSLLEQVILPNLLVSRPEQLVNLAAPGPKPGSQSCTNEGPCDDVFSYPMFRDMQRAAKRIGFTDVAAHVAIDVNVAYREQTATADGLLVSGTYFPVLGTRPALGRLLGPGDDADISGDFVAVLGYSFWQSKLGGSPDIVGTRVVINGQTMTIVGVAPAGFSGTAFGVSPAVYVPITMQSLMTSHFAPSQFHNRRAYWLYLFARLAPGTTIDAARSAANTIYGEIINDVEAPLQSAMSAQGIARFRARQLVLRDGRRGRGLLRSQTRMPLVLLFGSTVIVFLIACANVANLLLARAAGRATEMAVRVSLGATRARLIRQLLGESCALSLTAGLASVVVAYLALRTLPVLLPAGAAAAFQLELRWDTIAFSGLASLAAGVLIGLYPAINASKPELDLSLRAGSGRLVGARTSATFRAALVVAQVALSLTLLIGAALFLKSLRNVNRVDLGINADRIVQFSIAPSLNGYSTAKIAALFPRLKASLEALPTARSVSYAMIPVLAGGTWSTNVSVQGFLRAPDADASAAFNEVGPDYFSTLQMPLLEGRALNAADVAGAPAVAVVNQAFTRKFHLGTDAVGKFIGLNLRDSLNIQIVGVVADAMYANVKDNPPPTFFLPAAQDTTLSWATYYVRTRGDPAEALRVMPRLVAAIDPTLPVQGARTLAQQVSDNVFMDRLVGALSSAFAVLATLLAAVGLYGVLAYSVAQRTREIGVRMALGADTGAVRRLILRQVVQWLAVGTAFGGGGALALSRTAKSLLFQTSTLDPAAIGVAVCVIVVVVLCAAYVPAWRASRVQPMDALRYE